MYNDVEVVFQDEITNKEVYIRFDFDYFINFDSYGASIELDNVEGNDEGLIPESWIREYALSVVDSEYSARN
jgi:hypothetical protein